MISVISFVFLFVFLVYYSNISGAAEWIFHQICSEDVYGPLLGRV